jgi:hypothetical protein
MKLMKTLSTLLFVFAVLAVNAQTTRPERSLESVGTQRGKETSGLSLETKPNEIQKGKVTYSGIAVQAVKTRRPLQLLNPAAPAKYGSAEDNALRDPITGRVHALNILSLRF